MVSFERALMTSYVNFSSILTRFRDIAALCSSTTLFPTPPLVSPEFLHVPLGIGGWPLGYEERRCWANCRAITFQDFQPMWSWSTNITDGQTTCDRKIALCTIVHRVVINVSGLYYTAQCVFARLPFIAWYHAVSWFAEHRVTRVMWNSVEAGSNVVQVLRYTL